MTMREKIKFFAISNKTPIQLGTLIAIFSLIGPPVYKVFAKVEVHESQIARNTSDIKSLQVIRDDVGYIKGAVDEIRKQRRR